MASERKDTCEWIYYDWPESEADFSGECGIVWSFSDGGLEENGVKFCPRCGGAVQFAPPAPDEEESPDA